MLVLVPSLIFFQACFATTTFNVDDIVEILAAIYLLRDLSEALFSSVHRLPTHLFVIAIEQIVHVAQLVHRGRQLL